MPGSFPIDNSRPTYKEGENESLFVLITSLCSYNIRISRKFAISETRGCKEVSLSIELSFSHIQQRFVPRLAIVSALISLGVLAVITITLSMRTVSSNELYEKGAQKLALGLKGSDIRLLQVSIAAQYFFCDQK